MSISDFVRHSNAIEGIRRDPSVEEIAATKAFIALPEISIANLIALVAVYQPGAAIRDKPNLNVRVGSHVAPKGGAALIASLGKLLTEINAAAVSPWRAHVEYETLHPFTDGNGRSGRAVWLWQIEQMGGTRLEFLHAFYYQTLENSR